MGGNLTSCVSNKLLDDDDADDDAAAGPLPHLEWQEPGINTKKPFPPTSHPQKGFLG